MQHTAYRFPLGWSGDAHPMYLEEWLERWEQIVEGDTFYAADVVALLSWGFNVSASSGSSDADRAAAKRREKRRVEIYASIIEGMNHGDEHASGRDPRHDDRLYWGTRGKIEREAWRVTCEHLFRPIHDYVKVLRNLEAKRRHQRTHMHQLIRRAAALSADRALLSALSDSAVQSLVNFFDPAHRNHRLWWKVMPGNKRSDEDKWAVAFWRLFLRVLWSPTAEKEISRDVLAHARRTTHEWFTRMPNKHSMLLIWRPRTAWERLLASRSKKTPSIRTLLKRSKMRFRKKLRSGKRRKLPRLVRGSYTRIDCRQLKKPANTKKMWRM